MLTSSAAWITFRLAPASTSLPSIVSFGMSRRLLRRRGLERTAPELDVRFELVPILGHEALHRHRETVGEHADSVAFHVAGGVHHHLEVFHLAAPRFEVDEQFFDPAASLAARRALSA